MIPRRLRSAAVAGALALAAGAAPARAQTSGDDAFLDADARVLHAKARARWEQVDGSLVRYQAVVSERLAAALRLPVRDRTLYASETSARIIWERDGGVAVQMLAAAEHLPWGFARTSARHRPELFDEGFDPAGDPLLLGLGDWDDDEIGFVHPLDVHAEESYRFRTADTLTLSFADGRSVRAVELDLLPRRDDPRLLSGALWIEPETGNLVRAVYRLARTLNLETDTDIADLDDLKEVPGLFRPFTIDVTAVAVDYALWDLRVWMPRTMRVEGTARAGIVKVPVSMETAYEIEEVVTDDPKDGDKPGADAEPSAGAGTLGLENAFARLSDDAAKAAETVWKEDVRRGRRRGKSVRYLVPEDMHWLADSPHLPAPIWKDDATFVAPAELEELKGVLGSLPGPATVTTIPTFEWGIQRPDLVRYNRVEGLSVGARGAVRFGAFGAPLSASLTARLGTADLDPRATLALTRESLARTTTLSAYRELRLVEPSARAFGFGNSLEAVLFGRDDGDYYQSTGASLEWAPPAALRPSWRARVYAERQDSVRRNTQLSLFHAVGWADGFRGNPTAVRADQLGAELTLSPSWGHDPERFGAGLDLGLQAEQGDYDFQRGRLDARVALPLPRGGRLALAAGGGGTLGDAPAQRRWILGGPFSLRGFAPGVLSGPTFLSSRAELIVPLRRLSGARAVRLALFGDGGWAGAWDARRWDDAIGSAGIGLSILDGIVRLDAAWGWKGPPSHRVDLYLDGLL